MAVPAPVRQALEMNYEPFPPDIPMRNTFGIEAAPTANGAAAQSPRLSRNSGTTLGRPANMTNPNGVVANLFSVLALRASHRPQRPWRCFQFGAFTQARRFPATFGLEAAIPGFATCAGRAVPGSRSSDRQRCECRIGCHLRR